jgi:hypothetical protein
MTHTVFKCRDCGQKFKVSGGAFSCGLYAFSKESMEYNQLEKINESGKERVKQGMRRAIDYDEHCNSRHDFVVESSDDGF